MKKKKLILTLCVLRHNGRILLGMKKKGLGAGRWNAFGGKVEAGESIEAAAVREMKEESGLDVTGVEKVGVLSFAAPERPDIEMHIFRASDFSGTPVETDEMKPKWFTKETIPFEGMWKSDLYWWPVFMRGQLFRGSFTFDKDDRVISHEIEAVATLAE